MKPPISRQGRDSRHTLSCADALSQYCIRAHAATHTHPQLHIRSPATITSHSIPPSNLPSASAPASPPLPAHTHSSFISEQTCPLLSREVLPDALISRTGQVFWARPVPCASCIPALTRLPVLPPVSGDRSVSVTELALQEDRPRTAFLVGFPNPAQNCSVNTC